MISYYSNIATITTLGLLEHELCRVMAVDLILKMAPKWQVAKWVRNMYSVAMLDKEMTHVSGQRARDSGVFYHATQRRIWFKTYK